MIGRPDIAGNGLNGPLAGRAITLARGIARSQLLADPTLEGV
jgi:hypothetical protein